MLCSILKHFNKAEKSKICTHLAGSLVFDYKNRALFCPYSEIFEASERYNGITINTDKLISERSNYIKSSAGKCSRCPFFEQADILSAQIKTLYLSGWHFCCVNCVYCTHPKIENLISAGHNDIFPAVKELMSKKLINKKTKIVFECGDACSHPEFDKIMFYFLNNDFENIELNTSAQRFCESAAQGISQNKLKVIVPLDSACRHVFKWIKGIDKFDTAFNNVKRYLECQMPDKKNVIIKYNIMQGINDNMKEPLDLFILARDTGVNKLIFDIEKTFFETSLKSIPLHIKNIITFLKNIADYNMYDIEFAPRLKILNDLISDAKT